MWWPFKSRPSRRVLTPVQQAADTSLNKRGKLDLAREAVVLGQLREIASDEIRDSRKLKARHLGEHFDCGTGGEDVGDLIIGDDIHFHQPPSAPPPSRAWPMAAGLALGGGLIAAALALPQYLRPSQTAIVEPAQPPAINTTIEKRSGFILNLPGSGKE